MEPDSFNGSRRREKGVRADPNGMIGLAPMERNSRGIGRSIHDRRFVGGCCSYSVEAARGVALAAANYGSPINRINDELHEKSVIALERVSAAP